jgi:acetyl-CoA acetyltransferase
MPEENLTADERAAVLKVLRDTIAADRYPLSPRMRTLKSAVAKLDPASMQRVSAPATAEALDQQHDRSKEALALNHRQTLPPAPRVLHAAIKVQLS